MKMNYQKGWLFGCYIYFLAIAGYSLWLSGQGAYLIPSKFELELCCRPCANSLF